MKHTNINITSPHGTMEYYFEYLDVNDFSSNRIDYDPHPDERSVDFYDENTNTIRKGNEWIAASIDDLINTHDITQLPNVLGYLHRHGIIIGKTPLPEYFGSAIPYEYNISTLRIFFPRFSVDTYEKRVKYAINITTWINGHTINIGSYIIDRNDVIAASTVRTFANKEYYEYIPINIIDPWYLIYSDEWKDFRQIVCGEYSGEGREEINTTGSVLNVTLHPVREVEDGVYREIENYIGGQNAINLADEVTDYLRLNIEENYIADEPLTIDTNVTFNEAYAQTLVGFKQYIKETYSLTNFKMFLEMIIQDQTDIFKYAIIELQTPWQSFNVKTYLVDNKPFFLFDNWQGYHEGIYINMFLHLCQSTETGIENSIIALKSNRILVTQELFRHLVKSEDNINLVNLDEIEMNIFHIKAVNKVEQKVVQVERPDDYKANIIKPVFFRTQPLASLVIHPAVTEHICLNLDNYKSKVTTFVISINGILFNEEARTTAGVIFKIVGPSLPQSPTGGAYYILNENNEMVTSGSYKYEA